MSVFFWVSFGILWLLVVIQGFAFLEVLRQVGQIRHQLEPQQGALLIQGAVQEGDALPELEGYSAKDHRRAKWEDYLNPTLSVVVLLSTHCLTCRSLAEDITQFVDDIKKDASIIVILEGKEDEVQEFINATRLDRSIVIIDEKKITAQRLGVIWNPAAITVPEGKLGKAAVIHDIHQLSALVHSQEAKHVLS